MWKFETTMSAQGKVTLPIAVREALDLRPGDTLIFDRGENGRVELRAEPRAATGRRATPGDLLQMQTIARAARRSEDKPDGDDPIGDYLVSEDERTKTRR